MTALGPGSATQKPCGLETHTLGSRACIEDKDGAILADGFYIYQPERFSTTFFPLFEKLQQCRGSWLGSLHSSNYYHHGNRTIKTDRSGSDLGTS
jgi:hypothetical protein